MRHLTLLSLFLLCVFSSSDLRAQTASDASDQVITGRVIDGESQSPIPFVYVLLSRAQDRGVLTNETGEFRLPYTAQDIGDSINISRIGYEVYTVSLTELIELQEQSEQIVLKLKSEFVNIPAVTVRASRSPDAILKRAIKRIPVNYGSSRYQMDAYYRQFGLRNGEYTDMSEAYVTIEDAAYLNPRAKSVVYMEYLDRNVYDDEQSSDFIDRETNPIYSLYEDQNNSARVQQVHWLSYGKKDFFEIFDFTINNVFIRRRDTIVSIGYQINPDKAGLSPKAIKTLSGWTRGEVWISLKDHAILRNTRGDENGNVFSEVYYTKLSGKYYPTRITSVYAIDYDRGDYYVYNRMLCFSTVTNQKERMQAKAAKATRLHRKKPLGEVRHINTEVSNQRKILRISAPEASVIEEARRKYQMSLGTEENGNKAGK